ncbi:hypothetical protein GGI25_003440 [Coemansia spiralis]|uniref:CBS domain-containing protein n=2 Tax=Coemansia TaxID=4863 RepID=A0A9W8KWK0_9FUNG|nr:hypothetical protein BX070DRAFT_249418 [Coemansia spiralis]KAJ1994257.1 hypothetical protein EDC05_001699 [Coemansia umbellata]KAJ2621248.1 hypothetical protein GGI26_004321 [Coemansia sp. RSA 1358]KAJ2676795.1 hypothetical protein GGI25_003440 [Coemansia spiralis]
MKASELAKYTVYDVLEYRGNPRLYYSVNESSNIEDALALMNKHNIVSLPVFGDSATSSDRAFVDIVSVYDLRDYIVNSPGLEKEVEFQMLSGRASGKPTVLQDTIAQVVRSRKHASQEIAADASLEDLVRLFSVRGQHRVLVTGLHNADKDAILFDNARQVPNSGRARGVSVDSGCSSILSLSVGTNDNDDGDSTESAGAVCGLTQYDVLRFIQHHNHELGHALLDTSVTDIVKELPQAHTSLVYLTIRDSALHAFKQLSSVHASALPVVDYDGQLITEVAGASLRRLNTGSVGFLGKPVLAFMFGLRIPVDNPYIIHSNFNISQIMSGLLQMNCRRAWLVDSNNRPIAVISLADVLRHLL